jgi:hypothetical protein
MQYPIIDLSITAIQFKMCFTPQERVAIRALRETDDYVDDMFDILDDPRTETVNLALPQVQEMMLHLVDVNVISSNRMYEILHAYIPGTDNPPAYTPPAEPAPEPTPEE